MHKVILRKLAEMPSQLFYIKDNINRFVEKLILVINKSIEVSILFQKIITWFKSKFNFEYKVIQIRAYQLQKQFY